MKCYFCNEELEFREDEKLDEDIEPDFDHAFTLDCPTMIVSRA